MKQPLIFILMLVLNCTVAICVAQKRHFLTADKMGFVHVDTTRSHFFTPTVVEQGNNKPFMVRHIIEVREDCIYNGLYKPKSEAVQRYGQENLIRVILKPEVKIFSLKDLLKKYHISRRYLNLPVFVDMHQLYPVEPLMATEHSIGTIEIIKDPDSNEELISIITNSDCLAARLLKGCLRCSKFPTSNHYVFRLSAGSKCLTSDSGSLLPPW